MEQLVATFHLNLGAFIAQVINFAVVAAVLWFFVLRPLRTVMEKRTRDIEKGLKDAKSAATRLAEAEKNSSELIADAKRKGDELVRAAQAEALAQRESMKTETKIEIEKLVASAKSQIAAEREKMRGQLAGDVAGLVAQSLKKLLGRHFDEKKDREWLVDELKAIKK